MDEQIQLMVSKQDHLNEALQKADRVDKENVNIKRDIHVLRDKLDTYQQLFIISSFGFGIVTSGIIGYLVENH